jgi:hypothetical protein
MSSMAHFFVSRALDLVPRQIEDYKVTNDNCPRQLPELQTIRGSRHSRPLMSRPFLVAPNPLSFTRATSIRICETNWNSTLESDRWSASPWHPQPKNRLARHLMNSIWSEKGDGKQLDDGIAILWYGIAIFRRAAFAQLPADTKVPINTFAQ